MFDTLHNIRYTARAREHLSFDSGAKSAIKDSVYFCPECIEEHFSVYDFTVLNKSCTEYEIKV